MGLLLMLCLLVVMRIVLVVCSWGCRLILWCLIVICCRCFWCSWLICRCELFGWVVCWYMRWCVDVLFLCLLV